MVRLESASGRRVRSLDCFGSLAVSKLQSQILKSFFPQALDTRGPKTLIPNPKAPGHVNPKTTRPPKSQIQARSMCRLLLQRKLCLSWCFPPRCGTGLDTGLVRVGQVFFVEVLRFGRSCFQAGVQHRGSSGQGNEDVVSVRERHPGLPLRRIA